MEPCSIAIVRSVALWLSLCLVPACGGSGGDDDGGGGDPGDATAIDGGGGGGDDGAPPGDDGGTAAGCEDYCDAISAACTGSLQQYYDRGTCLASCALFPAGQPGDDSGDSRACRMHHAELAASDPDPHCYHAGPSGAGVCGAPCAAYCDIMQVACPDEYADDGECMDACAGFPDTRPYSVLENRGDTLACRIFHATRSSTNDLHCGTASADSPPCTN